MKTKEAKPKLKIVKITVKKLVVRTGLQTGSRTCSVGTMGCGW